MKHFFCAKSAEKQATVRQQARAKITRKLALEENLSIKA